MPCGGTKKSPHTSSIVQTIFSFGPLRSIKIFKTLTFRNILLSNVLIVRPRLGMCHCVIDLDFSYKFSTLQHKYLAFVASLKRATDEGSLAKIAQCSPYCLSLNIFTASKGLFFYIYFAITAAGVVPCGGPKKYPYTSSIVQTIFSFGPIFKTLMFRNILLGNVLIV